MFAICFVDLHNKPNFDLSSCYEFLPSIYKGHNHMVFDTLKFEAFVDLHNDQRISLLRSSDIFPSIYKGFEIDVLRGVNLKTAIVFVALHNKPNFDLSSCCNYCPL